MADLSPAEKRAATLWVRREKVADDLITGAETAGVGWTGPFEDREGDAQREADAWRSCGWAADVLPDSAEIRAAVADWQERAVDSWKTSTDPSQKRRYWEREAQRREATP